MLIYADIHLVTTRLNVQGPLLLTWFNFNPGIDK